MSKLNFSKEVEEINSKVLAEVESRKCKKLDIAFYEKAFVELYSKYFEGIVPKHDMEKLKIDIEECIDDIVKFTEEVIEYHERMGNPLPVIVTKSVMEMRARSEAFAKENWITGEISLSHVFMALVESNYIDSAFFNYFNRHVNESRAILQKIVETEAQEYGIELAAGAPVDDIEQYVTDLVEKAKEYKKPFVGREDVIESTVRILSRMDKNNPVYVGEPGTGKTAVVHGLAKRILDGNVPEKLKDAKLYSVDLSGMVAGAKFRGQFEERLKKLLNVMEEKENVILFFDEIHTIVGAGACGDGAMDAANIIKPILADGDIKFIGATTYDEYRQHIEKDKALARRFQVIDIVEPSIEDATEILMGLKEAYENFHGIKYTEKAIKTAVELSAKYINDRFLPDKAIDIIDEAGAHYSIHKELGKKIDHKMIEDVIKKICKIHQVEVAENEMEVVATLDKKLTSKVFGQNEAIKSVVESIQLAKSGLGDEEKPIASFLFVGPSGVGKTEIAKQLANVMQMDFIRFDMSEYSDKMASSKFIGASAGYVGYENGGILTNEVMKKPNSVILFDEIEKADPEIFNSFLQIMDYGMLTDNKGRKANFRNCIIIMTSNAGSRDAAKKKMGLTPSNETTNKEAIMDAVNRLFTPEFRGRLTDVLVFNGINNEIGRLIAKKELKVLTEKLKKKKINPTYSDSCIDELVRIGVSDEYGAREIKKVIDEKIKKLFVSQIISGKLSGKCLVDFKNGEFLIEEKKFESIIEMMKK